MLHPKTFGLIQLAVGTLGLLACGWLYLSYCDELHTALERADELAADATLQAETGEAMLGEWIEVTEQLDRTLVVHSRSLQAARHSTEMVGDSLARWQQNLMGLSDVTTDASLVANKFAELLPLKIPNLEMNTRKIDLQIPEFELQQQTVKIPYPTASVGTRKTKLDLGLTDLDVNLPTLNLGTGNRTVTVPATPKVSQRTESVTVPSDLKITQHEFLADEKKLLSKSGEELRAAADSFRGSAATLDSVVDLIQQDLASSLDETEVSLLGAQQLLEESHQSKLPELLNRLQNQKSQVIQAKPVFKRLQGLVPWLFVIGSLIPLAILLQGCVNIRREK